MELIEQNVSVLATQLGTTPEVLIKFLSDAEASEEVKPFADQIGTLHVYRPEELATRIANESKELVQRAVANTTGTTYEQMDKRILLETGIAKEQGEKTGEYMIRAAKTKFGTKAADESEEMKNLRTDLQAKEELLRTKDTELQSATTKLAEKDVEFATRLQQTQTNALIDSAINAVKIDAPEKLLPGQRKLLKAEFNERYEAKVVEGKTIYTDKATGKEKRDSHLAEPMSAEAIINEFAPTVVSVKQSQRRGTEVRDTGKNTSSDTQDFAAYENLEAYQKMLQHQGVASYSAQYQQLMAKALAHFEPSKT